MSDQQQQQQQQRPKTKMSTIYLNQNSGGSWSEFFVDIFSGVAVGIGHSKTFAVKAVTSLTGMVSSSSADSENSSSIDNGKLAPGDLKVIGVGYGRTGTYSLALALDELGFPTLHTQHLYENEKIFAHFVDNIFYKSIQQDEVITPDMYTPDFDLLVNGGFTATMDLPFALYYKQIHELYPDCKFILTVRENSEVWFRSWDVMTKSITQPAQYGRFFSDVNRLNYYMRWLFSIVNSDKKYLNAPFPLPAQNKAKSILSYEAHNEKVRNSIPSSQLLEYNVRQGWEPLCKFLEIPEANCPSTHGIPFPKTNSARAVTWQAYSSFIGPLVLTVFILFSMISLGFRKVTGMSIISWCVLMKARFMHWTHESLKKRNKNKLGAKMD
mmetsp:Transcript_24042/g.34381  ORF Transcript_24042/g.34381 Transcript_24042/m.34381 type:complete len:382 (+) Transcript_24042:102-1247(+)